MNNLASWPPSPGRISIICINTPMFLQNRYTVIYYAIIAQARSSPRKKKTGTYYENHHIIPRSIGGTNSKDWGAGFDIEENAFHFNLAWG